MQIKIEDIKALVDFAFPKNGKIDVENARTIALFTSSEMRNTFRNSVMNRVFSLVYERLPDRYKADEWQWLCKEYSWRYGEWKLRKKTWPVGLFIAFEIYADSMIFGIFSPSTKIKQIGSDVLPDAIRNDINSKINSSLVNIGRIWKKSEWRPAYFDYSHNDKNVADAIYAEFATNLDVKSKEIVEYFVALSDAFDAIKI